MRGAARRGRAFLAAWGALRPVVVGVGGLAWLAALCLALAASPAAADLTALVDSVVATYGGPQAVARSGKVRVDAEVAARMRGDTGAARREFEAPDRLRVEIAYPGTVEVRILDGDRGWRGDRTRLDKVDGLPRAAMEYQLLRSAVPWVLVHHRGALEDRGTRTVDGTAYRLVGLRRGEALDLTYWIDAANRRVIRVEGVLQAPGAQTTFDTRYGDFRRVDGVLVPFVEENFAGGQHTGTTRVTSVVFSPPDLGPFAPTGRPR